LVSGHWRAGGGERAGVSEGHAGLKLAEELVDLLLGGEKGQVADVQRG
jgi:hypothetical protein